MTASPTYVFAGGGTGGHLFPGLAVAEELLSRDGTAEIQFIGCGRGLERAIISAYGYGYWPLSVEPSTGLRRRPLRFVRRNWRAYRAARRWLAARRPEAVIGLGGFASVPVVWAATRSGLRTILLEQNVVPGRATRWLSRRASAVCLAFSETASRLPKAQCIVTGNPVRSSIARLATDDPGPRVASRGTGNRAPTLLILGGSQGARAVNEAVLSAAEPLSRPLAGWNLLHQTGRDQEALVRNRYRALGLQATVSAFFDEPASLYAQADLAISRAGGTTLAELACAGCPAVMIPYPHAVDDHQLGNARIFEAPGACRIVRQSPDAAVTAERLREELSLLLEDPRQLAKMSQAMRALARPVAAEAVADELMSLPRRDPGPLRGPSTPEAPDGPRTTPRRDPVDH